MTCVPKSCVCYASLNEKNLCFVQKIFGAVANLQLYSKNYLSNEDILSAMAKFVQKLTSEKTRLMLRLGLIFWDIGRKD